MLIPRGLRLHYLALCAALVHGVPASAQPPRFQISIAPAEARTALNELARQTRTPLLYLDQDIEERIARAVYGLYTVEEALRLLLEDSGLHARINDNGVIVVRVEETAGHDTVPEPALYPGEGDDSRRHEVRARESRPRWGEPALEEVVVTGSRLRRAMGSSGVSVTSVLPGELAAFERSGSLAERLDVLPQFFRTQSAQRGGGALYGSAGGSYLDMRGMGAARTLILFDGSRVVPADRGGTVNVDTLPVALLRGVEIVTGGASAAYGADALAGVVNFVLDREFEGLRLDGSSGMSARGDG